MIKNIHFESWVERTGHEGMAEAKTAADDGELLITLCHQPIQATKSVDHALAGAGDGPANVRRDGILRTVTFARLAGSVVGQGNQ
jgi:hypothetical protein